MRPRKRVRLALVGGLCAAIGAGAGIAGSNAASTKSSARSSQAQSAGRPPFHRGPEVHAEEVVLNRAGDGFITVTEDGGIVDSVSGDQLTIKEGTKSVTYKTVTLTIPSNAKVYRNFVTAQLSDLQSNDAVHVSRSSEGTVVMANDASHAPPRGHGPPGPGAPAP